MNPSTEKVIDEARRLLEKWGNRDAARRRLSQAIQVNPNDAELWYWMARALDTRSHVVDALRRALKVDPTHRDAQRYLDWLEKGVGDASEWPIAGGLPEGLTPTAPAPIPPPAPAAPPAVPTPPASAPAQQEAEDILAWLNDNAAPATPSTPVTEEPASKAPPLSLDWLMDEGEVEADFVIEAGEVAAPVSTPDTPPADESWSFLAELEGGSERSPSVTAAPPPPATPAAPLEEHGWSFLDELETASGSGSPKAATQAAPGPPPALTEESLWHRAEQILGPVPAHLTNNASIPQKIVPPRGVFTFQDVPPSPAASLPVRNSLLPLTRAQVEAALQAPAPAPAKGTGKEAKAKAEPKETKGKKETAPKAEKAPRRGGGLGRLLVPLVVLALVGAALWFALRNDLIPEQVKSANPAVATQIAALQSRLSPGPTPLPRPDWLATAETARYANRVGEAEQILRDSLAGEPSSVAGLIALSDLLRERPGREGEGLAVAEQALAAVTSVDERAWASEAFVWAMAVQPQPDLGRALASAEQALAETPRSPHAHWSRAMAAALEGNAELARTESAQAIALSSPPSPSGVWDARQAEIAARLNDPALAAQLYEKALQTADYVPWRVALVRVLRTLQTPEAPATAEFHLNHLRTIAPDDPAVQALGQ